QTLSRTEYAYDSPTTTGNLTQQKSWDSTKGGCSNPLHAGNSVSVSHQYDSYGNRWLTTDARGVQTHLTFGAVGGHTGLYPTEVRTAYGTGVQRTEAKQYDFHTGLVTRTTDADNGVSTSTAYDAFGRPALVREAEGKPEERRTATEYHDAARRVVVRADLDSAGDSKLVSVKHYDRLGRVRLARQLENAATQSATDEAHGIKVQTRYRYSGANSFQLVSNPYRAASAAAAGSEQTMGWSLTKRDRGGRVVAVTSYSGAPLPSPWGANANTTGTVTTSYDAEFTTITDQAGKVRRNMSDGLGRLARVDEPDAGGNLGPTNSPVQPTGYAYDVNGNLTLVSQGAQTRTFAYSSLSRLASAANPESGAVSYLYDDSGNMTRKTDARSVQTNFTYDPLGRTTSKTYSDGTPPVAYFYDTQALPAGAPAVGRGYSRGRLVAVTYGGGSASSYNGYDDHGRVLTRVQQTDGVTYVVDAAYTQAGTLTTETYPAAPGHAARRVVSRVYDGASRLA
ncbi:MAG TPA: hypothetical protein VEQ42_03755, partial [Pyrinomonadaceae bacterium]|nr:hypothetical protein [Pyrinomonadaceae bacterium]